MVLGSKTCVGEIFGNRPDRHRDPPNFLRNANRASFSGVHRPGGGVDHSPPSIAEVVNE